MARIRGDGARFFGSDPDDAAHLVEPERTVRRFDDSADRSESLSAFGENGLKSSIAENREPSFTAEPIVRPASADDSDASDVDAIPARVRGHAFAIEHFDESPRIAE